MTLNPFQDGIALNLLKDYIENGEVGFRPDLNKEVSSKELDEKRLIVIQKTKVLLNNFFNQNIELKVFKHSIDVINKKNRLWGFKGINGMMFFNMLYNGSNKVGLLPPLNQTLVDCLKVPQDVKEAKEKIKRFVFFVGTINNSMLSEGISKRKAPRIKSSLFFLSYFWQIQDPERFPIFYNSLELSFKNLGFLVETKDLSIYYASFFGLNNYLRNLFRQHLNRKIDFWYVEHVIWHYYNSEIKVKTKISQPQEISGPIVISDEFLPPIIADLPLIAKSDETIKQKYPSKELEDVFEDKVYHFFRFMKFDVEKLGRGKRAPDGIVKDRHNHYAIIYDCKCRKDRFSLNAPDERTIIEYIHENKRKLKKEGMENIYFMIISSDFHVSEKQLVKIKIESRANSIILMRAEQLLSILKRYFMDPNIDKDDLEKLLAITRVIEEQDIQDILMGA